jgi:hypothetical protein
MPVCVLTFSITIFVIITIMLVIITVTDVITKIPCGPKTFGGLISWTSFLSLLEWCVSFLSLQFWCLIRFLFPQLSSASRFFRFLRNLSFLSHFFHCHFLSDENAILWAHFPPVVYCRVFFFFGSGTAGRGTMVKLNSCLQMSVPHYAWHSAVESTCHYAWWRW